jgi:diguanylate cyclase (GGDEF)-like protein/PAS domain S-box-containing protein
MMGAVGLIIYLSYRNGQKAVEHLVSHLMLETGDRIEYHLENHLQSAIQVAENNAVAAQLGWLDRQNLPSIEKYFWQQKKIYPNLAAISMATEAKEILIVEKLFDGSQAVRIRDKSNNYQFQTYLVDEQYQRQKLLQRSTSYDPHLDPPNNPWYGATKQAGKPIWRLVVSGAQENNPLLLAIYFHPFFDKNQQFQGITGASVSLAEMGEFLKSLNIGEKGQVFVMTKDGRLIATSTGEKPFHQGLMAAPTNENLITNLDPQKRQLEVLQSTNPLTRKVGEYLQDNFGSFTNIQTSTQLTLRFNHQRYFLQVIPFNKFDQQGNLSELDWLTVVVIPESDFLGEIQDSNFLNIILGILTLLTAIVLGIATAYWINRPILQISQASQAIAQGIENQEALPENILITELQTLARSFNLMSSQVNKSFQQVETALQESQEKYYTLFKSLPVGVSITDYQGRMIENNPTWRKILGLSALTTDHSPQIPLDVEFLRPDFSLMSSSEYPCSTSLAENRSVENQEMLIRHPDGRITWLSVSAAPIPLEEYGTVITYVDISDRKQIEIALLASEKRFRRLSENIPGMIYQFVVHTDGTDQFTYMSSMCRQIYEMEPSVAIADSQMIWRLVHPEDQAKLREDVNISSQYLQPFFSEHRLIMTDGRQKWVQVSAKPEKQTNGDIVWDGLVVDITDRQESAIALQEAQYLIQQIADYSPQILYIFDPINYTNIYINRQSLEILGYHPDEFLAGGTWFFLDILHPNDQEAIVKNRTFWHKAKDQEILTVEYRMRHKNGNWVWLRSQEVVFARDEQGRVTKILGTAQNITSQKEIEIALRESEQKFATIFNTNPDAIWISIFNTGIALDVNNSLCQLLEGDRSDFIGKTSKEIGVMPDEDLQRIRYLVQTQGYVENEELILTTLKGNQKNVLLSGKIMTLRGENCGIVIIKDISDRKQAQEALRQSEARLQAFLQNSPAVMFMKDLNGRYVLINKEFEENFNITPDQVIGKTDYDFLSTKIAEAFIQHDQRALAEGKAINIEEVVEKPDGIITSIVTKFPMFDVEGQPYAIAGIALDITDRKRAEAELQKSEERFQKIAALSPGMFYIAVNHPDGSTSFEYVSSMVETIMGITAEEMMADPKSCLRVFHPEDIDGFFLALAECKENLSIFTHQWRIITSTGEIKWLQASERPALRPNGDLAWYGITIDITDRKEAEMALAETEAKLRKANKELQHLVNIDGLTQIANRRRFDQVIQKEWYRHLRSQEYLSLVLIDIDFFKLYNDHYGHQQGDDCLIQVAQVIDRIPQRPGDLAARYGGEEFVVVLPNTDAEGALIVTTAMQKAIASLQLPHVKSQVSQYITISLGISSLIPSPETSVDELIAQADQALYQAKQQGRNQAIVFSGMQGEARVN